MDKPQLEYLHAPLRPQGNGRNASAHARITHLKK
jgi:hypothetical protein